MLAPDMRGPRPSISVVTFGLILILNPRAGPCFPSCIKGEGEQQTRKKKGKKEASLLLSCPTKHLDPARQAAADRLSTCKDSPHHRRTHDLLFFSPVFLLHKPAEFSTILMSVCTSGKSTAPGPPISGTTRMHCPPAVAAAASEPCRQLKYLVFRVRCM